MLEIGVEVGLEPTPGQIWDLPLQIRMKRRVKHRATFLL